MTDNEHQGLIWTDGSREELGYVLGHINDTADQLVGEGKLRLLAALPRFSTDGESIDLENLAQADIDELWELVHDIASDNGAVWEVRYRPVSDDE
jgi:hypothetical protein